MSDILGWGDYRFCLQLGVAANTDFMRVVICDQVLGLIKYPVSPAAYRDMVFVHSSGIYYTFGLANDLAMIKQSHIHTNSTVDVRVLKCKWMT